MSDMDYIPGPLADVDLGFKVGEEFLTLRRFEGILEERSAKNYVKYYKRDSKTMESAKRHNKFFTCSTLKFYSVKYGCIYSGKHKASQSTGKRCVKNVRQRTFCPAGILIKASKTNNFYQIVNIVNQHNHCVSKELYEQPARKIPKVNRKSVKEEECNTSYDQLTCEIMTSICDEIQDKHRMGFQLFYDEEQFKCGFFFSEIMTASMSAFPESFSIQSVAHEFLTSRCPIYIMAVENACGIMSIVGFFMILKDNTFKKSLNWMLENFISLIPDVSLKVKNIIISPDIDQKDVILQHFPNARHLSYTYSFVRNVFDYFYSDEAELTKRYESIRNLLKAKDENDFNEIITEMNLPNELLDFQLDLFKNEWQPDIGETIGNFLIGSINFIELFNSRLHDALLHMWKITTMLEKIIDLIEHNHNEHLKALSLSRNLGSSSSTGGELEYREVLTMYAFDRVLNEILTTSSNLGVIIGANEKTKKLLINGFSVTENSCWCTYFNEVQLPCYHIFKFRQIKNLPLYDPVLFSKRWTIDYSLSLFPNINFDDVAHLEGNSSDDSELTEKHNILKTKCKEIAKYGSKAKDDDFNIVNNLLEKIVKCYKQKSFCLKVKVTSRAVAMKESNSAITTDVVTKKSAPECFENNNDETSNLIRPCSTSTFSRIKFTLPSQMKLKKLQVEED